MTNLNNKYKDRKPQDTIDIIKRFFQSRGFEIIESHFPTEAGTWTAHLEMYKNNLYIIQSNGKGMTKDFCLASGYAELYERYCNMHPIICNTTFAKSLMEKNYQEKGYCFAPGEKILSYSEIEEKNPEISNFLTRSLKSKENVLDFLNTQFGTLIGIPFSATNGDSDKIYLDPRLASITWTSIGLSAGNTITEALTQSMSELCERIGTKRFFLEECDKYYSLDLTKIDNQEIQEKIHNIWKAGYKFYVFDLSYNFQVPTLMSLLIDPFNLLTRVNFGAYPVFDIAIERIITEIYQGIPSYKYMGYKEQAPFKRDGAVTFLNGALNNISSHCGINENIFNKIVTIDHYNENYFISKNHNNNSEMLDWLNHIFKELNLKCYYADMSLDENIKAIRVICPGLKLMEEKTRKFEKISPLLTEDALNIIKTEHKLKDKVLSLNNSESKEDIKEIYSLIEKSYLNFANIPQVLGHLIGNLTFCDINMIFNNCDSNILMVLSEWGENMNFDLSLFRQSYWLAPLKKYKTLLNYVCCNKYSHSEIKKIMSILGSEVTDEEIDNIQDVDYIIMKIYIQTTLALYNSPFYQDLVSQFLR